MKKPLVSILIPAYNAERWIADTIRSALDQTWDRKEIIVVDDGSTDNTLSLARSFASRHVCIWRQENQGGVAARNKALALSQGDVIQWLDADDLLAPDKIARQMHVLSTEGNRRTLISGSWGKFFYRVETAKFSPSPLWRDLQPVDWLLHKMGDGCHMQTATWLVTRELTEAAGPWDTRLLVDQDGEYFCRVILACQAIRFVPNARVYYRHTDRSRVSYIGDSVGKQDALFLSMQMHTKYLLSLEDSERTRAACVKYLQKFMFDFYPERPDIVELMTVTAFRLGGRLRYPQSSWKYAWIQALFGWRAAKRAQTVLPALKASFIAGADRLMFRLKGQPHRRGAHSAP